jgi:hypothetical protein
MLRGVFLAAMHADQDQVKDSFDRAISTAGKQKSIFLEKRAEADCAEYFRKKANGSGAHVARRSPW